MLKSEIAELKHRLVQPTHTKKEWLKDDLIAYMNERQKEAQRQYKLALNSVNEWRDKYFALMLKNKQ